MHISNRFWICLIPGIIFIVCMIAALYYIAQARSHKSTKTRADSDYKNAMILAIIGAVAALTTIGICIWGFRGLKEHCHRFTWVMDKSGKMMRRSESSATPEPYDINDAFWK
jgi:hypothetical protein